MLPLNQQKHVYIYIYIYIYEDDEFPCWQDTPIAHLASKPNAPFD